MDPGQFKEQFPLLEAGGMVYLDNATVNPLPSPVVAAIGQFAGKIHFFPNRGVHDLTIDSTKIYARAKQQLGGIIPIPKLIYGFVPNTTVALGNLLLSLPLHQGDGLLVVASINHALWGSIQQLALKLHLTVHNCPIAADGQADLHAFAAIVKKSRIRVAVWTALPVGLGIPQIAAPLLEITHEAGITSIIDYSRALGHVPLKFHNLYPDVILGNAWAGLYAPTGAAFLGINQELLNVLTPCLLGEGNIAEASWAAIFPKKTVDALEPGDVNPLAIAGLSAGLQFLQKQSLSEIYVYEQKILQELVSRLQAVPKCHLVGPVDPPRALLCSFHVANFDAHDVGLYMNQLYHTVVRTGQLCSQPLLRDLHVHDVIQVSVAPFIESTEIDQFCKNLEEIVGEFGK